MLTYIFLDLVLGTLFSFNINAECKEILKRRDFGVIFDNKVLFIAHIGFYAPYTYTYTIAFCIHSIHLSFFVLFYSVHFLKIDTMSAVRTNAFELGEDQELDVKMRHPEGQAEAGQPFKTGTFRSLTISNEFVY